MKSGFDRLTEYHCSSEKERNYVKISKQYDWKDFLQWGTDVVKDVEDG